MAAACICGVCNLSRSIDRPAFAMGGGPRSTMARGAGILCAGLITGARKWLEA